MAKLGIESAFRLLPLRPDSVRLMGFRFEGRFSVDRCLPMGCAVSGAYFEKFSTFLHSCISECSGHSGIARYLDDFLFVGPGDSGVFGSALSSALRILCGMGVTVAADKTQGPVTCLSYLGV